MSDIDIGVSSEIDDDIPTMADIYAQYCNKTQHIFEWQHINMPISISSDDKLYNNIYNIIDDNILTDIGDAIFIIPESIIDCIINIARIITGKPNYSENQSMLMRILDFDIDQDNRHLFTHYLNNAIRKEHRYFSKFWDNEIGVPGFEDGTEYINTDKLLRDQKKILWDTLKSTYLSKYKTRIDDRIRNEAFYIHEWKGIDFIAMPPLIAGYLYYRGIEKKFSIANTELQISLEPIRELVYRDNTVVSIGLELAPKSWPLRLIIAVGIEDGNTSIQFIGIGTNLNAVKRIINMQLNQLSHN
ncbi:MAG: hypothetical protein QXU32_00920 [Nitrososphaerales archaeon]